MPGEPGLPGWTDRPARLRRRHRRHDRRPTPTATTASPTSAPAPTRCRKSCSPAGSRPLPAPPGTYTVTATSGQDDQRPALRQLPARDLLRHGLQRPQRQRRPRPGRSGPAGLDGQPARLHAATSSPRPPARPTAPTRFANLGPGMYTIEEVNQTGWYQTQPVNPPGTYTVHGHQRHQPSRARLRQLPARERHRRGLQRPQRQRQPRSGRAGPAGLDGRSCSIPSGNTVATTTSDANGNYEFDNLFPGTFTVEEILQTGWIQTQPVNPNYYTFTTQSGLNETGLNFGNVISTENLSGEVYNDLNGNGMNDRASRRPGRAGRSTLLRLGRRPGGHDHQRRQRQLLVQRTCRSRHLHDRGDRPGRLDHHRADQSAGNLHRARRQRRQLTGLDFGNFQLVSVSGNVYNDLNGNGNQDPGEPGLQGWTVDVVDSGGTVVASAVIGLQRQLHDSPTSAPARSLSQEVVQSGWVHHPAGQPRLLLVHDHERRERRRRHLRQLQDDQRLAATCTTTWTATACRTRASRACRAGPSTWRIASGNMLATVLTDSNGNYVVHGCGPRHVPGGRGRADQLGADPAALPDGVHLHRQERPQPDGAQLRRPRFTGLEPARR